MSERFMRGLAAAASLTKAGKLGKATQQLLQNVLGNSAAKNKELRDLLDKTLPGGVAGDRACAPADDHAPGQFSAGMFANAAGSRAYKLYVPVKRKGGARPLIVMLHGCTQSPGDFAAGTRMNLCGDENECFILYPEQSAAANGSKCWNWFQAAHQGRDAGEPSIIAGLTRKIMKDHNIDADRVFIAGLSAGGAAAAIMAETYPDIYCAAGVHSGIACGAASDMTSAFAVMSGRGKARGAMADAKARAFVPMIVFHGDKDTTVHPSNGADVIARAGEQARLQRDIENASTAGRSYTRALYRDKKGRTLMEDWVIHGAGHAWSGGSASGSFTDPKGPDASREMLRFFLNQRR